MEYFKEKNVLILISHDYQYFQSNFKKNIEPENGGKLIEIDNKLKASKYTDCTL